MAKKRLIRIVNNRIFLTPEDSFGLESTSFPAGSLSFRPTLDCYLEVEGNYNDGQLALRITNYKVSDTGSFNGQALTGGITCIRFEKLDWSCFERLLGSYRRSVLMPFTDQYTALPEKKKLYQPPAVCSDSIRSPYVPGFVTQQEDTQAIREPETHFEEQVRVAYLDAEFCDGAVLFTKLFSWARYPLLFRIENAFIRAEFNSIKTYFGKALNGRKTFDVQVKATKRGVDIVGHEAHSADIAGIDGRLIEHLKIDRTRKLFSAIREKKTARSLFTADDIYANLSETNVFGQSGHDIVSILTGAYGQRNKKQLEYLSGSRQSLDHKVRFTLRPMFGFLFFIEGAAMDYFCWELLDSHATYVWAAGKAPGDHAALVELVAEQVTRVQEMGRELYRKDVRDNCIKGLEFYLVDHKGISTDEEGGFKDWRSRLERTLA